MRLISAKVGPFKSIESSGTVAIDSQVTVMVGMNEAGKTAFLHALHKSASVEAAVKFDPIEDYPRKNLTAYMKKHATEPEVVTILEYALSDAEREAINTHVGTKLTANFTFSLIHSYDNSVSVNLVVDEKALTGKLLSGAKLREELRAALTGAVTLRELAKRMDGVELDADETAFKSSLDARVSAAASSWPSVVSSEVWTRLQPQVPKFLYFDDYYTLPGKVNLRDLQDRVAQVTANPSVLEPKHRAVLALLRMADIRLDELSNPDGYEVVKAKLEGISNSITDQVFRYWKQNETLEVEFDIRTDPKDVAPFNSGPNLYIRIKNKRHRVTVPFDQRSKGFIWFFSFLAWFDSVQQQLAAPARASSLILLLDEPGLSLHALAQADFLGYIESLAQKHQVLYTTHSPFMIQPDRLDRVRVVEDRNEAGTVISSSLGGYGPKTLFPLQAALGYSLAQNLFISRRNLLIEGPSDMLYLRCMSSLLENERGVALRSEITLVPTGGLDKVATFVALIGARELELGVLHDSTGTADPRLASLVQQKMIDEKAVLTYADFRAIAAGKKAKGTGATAPTRVSLGKTYPATDIEDLLPVDVYLDVFNVVFKDRLGGRRVSPADLSAGDRIIERLSAWLVAEGIELRKGGGFNHYSVAAAMVADPARLGEDTLDKFHVLFDTVNGLFSPLAHGEGG